MVQIVSFANLNVNFPRLCSCREKICDYARFYAGALKNASLSKGIQLRKFVKLNEKRGLSTLLNAVLTWPHYAGLYGCAARTITGAKDG